MIEQEIEKQKDYIQTLAAGTNEKKLNLSSTFWKTIKKRLCLK